MKNKSNMISGLQLATLSGIFSLLSLLTFYPFVSLVPKNFFIIPFYEHIFDNYSRLLIVWQVITLLFYLFAIGFIIYKTKLHTILQKDSKISLPQIISSLYIITACIVLISLGAAVVIIHGYIRPEENFWYLFISRTLIQVIMVTLIAIIIKKSLNEKNNIILLKQTAIIAATIYICALLRTNLAELWKIYEKMGLIVYIFDNSKMILLIFLSVIAIMFALGYIAALVNTENNKNSVKPILGTSFILFFVLGIIYLALMANLQSLKYYTDFTRVIGLENKKPEAIRIISFHRDGEKEQYLPAPGKQTLFTKENISKAEAYLASQKEKNFTNSRALKLIIDYYSLYSYDLISFCKYADLRPKFNMHPYFYRHKESFWHDALMELPYDKKFTELSRQITNPIYDEEINKQDSILIAKKIIANKYGHVQNEAYWARELKNTKFKKSYNPNYQFGNLKIKTVGLPQGSLVYAGALSKAYTRFPLEKLGNQTFLRMDERVDSYGIAGNVNSMKIQKTDSSGEVKIQKISTGYYNFCIILYGAGADYTTSDKVPEFEIKKGETTDLGTIHFKKAK